MAGEVMRHVKCRCMDPGNTCLPGDRAKLRWLSMYGAPEWMSGFVSLLLSLGIASVHKDHDGAAVVVLGPRWAEEYMRRMPGGASLPDFRRLEKRASSDEGFAWALSYLLPQALRFVCTQDEELEAVRLCEAIMPGAAGTAAATAGRGG